MRRIRSRKRQGGTKRGLSVEGLETRRLLVGDVFVVGDSDNDGAFGSGDLVQAFQEGKFETGEEATFEQGDWNDDGVFDSSDLVFAFESGTYGVPQPLAADDGTPDGEDDGDPNGNEVEPPAPRLFRIWATMRQGLDQRGSSWPSHSTASCRFGV